jgi:AraC-like DNA-binding protein
MILASGHARFFGREVSPREVVLFSPGCAIDAVGLPDARTTHFLLPGDRIVTAAADLGVDLMRSPRALVISPGVDRLHHLQTIRERVDEIVDHRDLATWPEVEEELAETFLGLFDVAARGEWWSMPRSRAGVEHALQTRSYICSKAPDELDLDSLADDLGITRHHLNRCFRKHYDVSVHEFVNRWRLHLARGLLLQDGPTTRVTEVAYSCGFHHLGRFAAEYRELFSETPSETLKQVARQS